MVRISGIDLSNSKKIEYALTGIYGIGLTASRAILEAAEIDKTKLTRDLLGSELIVLRDVIETNYKVEDDLRRIVKQSVIYLAQINSFRGKRHRRNLPVRGQRTRTNAKTVKKTSII
jgi:small subunit ribosomal protein S13